MNRNKGMNKHFCSFCGRPLDIKGDGSDDAYEYRGAISCEEHFDEVIKRRDYQRQEVMAITEASVSSQRKGEFVNNRNKYHLGNVAADGLPMIKINEPLALQEYEGRPEKKQKK